MRTAATVLPAILLVACAAEPKPAVTGHPPSGAGPAAVRTSELHAGPMRETPRVPNPYGDNEVVRAEGERLYAWFNCAGCHGPQGGGGIGPPFADADWIYGGDPQNIFQSIVQGRPNGMPAYGGQIPDQEVWKIALHVRSLSKNANAK
jgi:cytochrome c oxidase cbb3-type subunit III